MTLYELTGHESGIIVYKSNEIIVTNWASMGEELFPMLFPIGDMVVGFPVEESWADNCTTERVDDFRTVLPGSIWLTDEVDDKGTHLADTDMEILSDANSDLLKAFLAPEEYAGDFSATVYQLEDGKKIVVPDMWV